MSFILGFFPLLIMLFSGLALYGLGKFMRRNGWGTRLDRLDTKVQKAQARIGNVFAMLGLALMGAGSILNHLPLLGSKQGSAIIDSINAQITKYRRK